MPDRRIAVYRDKDFSGESRNLGVGEHKGLGPRFNNQISSFEISEGLSVTVFDGDELDGSQKVFTSSQADLGTWNERISSMRVEEREAEQPGSGLPSVIIYENSGFDGKSQRLREGDYDRLKLELADNSISSFKIPRGWSLTVYSGMGFTGVGQTFTADTQALSADWNDQISSVRVRRGSYQERHVVVVYEDADFTGRFKAFRSVIEPDDTSSTAGTYTQRDFEEMTGGICSMTILPGLAVTVYDSKFFRGLAQVFEGDQRRLPAVWNDKIRCLKINRKSDLRDPPDRVVLYEDVAFEGRFQVLETGGDSAPELRLPAESLSSIKIPRGFRVLAYTGRNYSGTSMVFTESQRRLTEYNDKFSSLRVYPPIEEHGQVRLYSEPHFTGTDAGFCPGSYDVSSLEKLNGWGVGNDNVRSIYIPRGWGVVVYEHADFTGESRVFLQSQEELQKMDNRISSFRVYSQEQMECTVTVQFKRFRVRDDEEGGDGEWLLFLYADDRTLRFSRSGSPEVSGLGKPTYHFESLGTGESDDISGAKFDSVKRPWETLRVAVKLYEVDRGFDMSINPISSGLHTWDASSNWGVGDHEFRLTDKSDEEEGDASIYYTITVK